MNAEGRITLKFRHERISEFLFFPVSLEQAINKLTQAFHLFDL